MKKIMDVDDGPRPQNVTFVWGESMRKSTKKQKFGELRKLGKSAIFVSCVDIWEVIRFCVSFGERDFLRKFCAG
jgi:hypothetical protein